MVKNLQKTFLVLEYIAGQNKAVRPKELVEALDIPQGTVMRICKSLQKLGYLDQNAPRQGYFLGPLPFLLVKGKSPVNDLFKNIIPLLDRAAKELGEMVIFSVRRHNWRQKICYSNYDPEYPLPKNEFRIYDLYRSVSGRILLAYASEQELQKIIREMGLPSDDPDKDYWNYWPEAAGDYTKLQQELQKIRLSGNTECWIQDVDRNVYCYGKAVFCKETFIGALVVNFPESSTALKREQGRELIDQLSINIGKISETRKTMIS